MGKLEKGGYHEKNPAVLTAEQLIALHQARGLRRIVLGAGFNLRNLAGFVRLSYSSERQFEQVGRVILGFRGIIDAWKQGDDIHKLKQD